MNLAAYGSVHDKKETEWCYHSLTFGLFGNVFLCNLVALCSFLDKIKKVFWSHGKGLDTLGHLLMRRNIQNICICRREVNTMLPKRLIELLTMNQTDR